jgi:hypothetical protein
VLLEPFDNSLQPLRELRGIRLDYTLRKQIWQLGKEGSRKGMVVGVGLWK